MSEPTDDIAHKWTMIAIGLATFGGLAVAFFGMSEPPPEPAPPTKIVVENIDVGNWEPAYERDFDTTDAGLTGDASWTD